MFEVNIAMVMVFLPLMLAVGACVVCAVKPPHPIFPSAPAAPAAEEPWPDLEAPDEPAPIQEPANEQPAETPEQRKKRFKDLGAQDCSTKLSAKGKDLTARDKKFALQVFDNCKEYWKMTNCEAHHDLRRRTQKMYYKWRPDDVRKFASEISGISETELSKLERERDKDDEKNGPAGWVMPSLRTGATRSEVNKNALEVILPDMDEFIRDEVEKARKGGHLTVKILAETATKYFSCGQPIKPQRMKRCLKRLGYEYQKRAGKYVNRRNEPENLEKLKDFCEWVYNNVEYNSTTGLYSFTIPVAFGDGANEYTKSFRARSWVLREVPKLMTCEKSRTKDSGQRLNMLGAIYGNSSDMNSFTAWNSAQKGKNKYAKSEDIVDHTVAHVLPNLPPETGAVYVLDNASNNKKIEENLQYASSDDLHDWINENDPAPERFQKWWKENSEDKTEKQLQQALRKYLRKNIDEFTELYQLCRDWTVKLRYLPAYYPECNPIELIWAHIKAEYKRTDVNLPWRQRLDIAHEKITDEMIEKSFDRSIRYCLDRLQELRATDIVHGEVPNEDKAGVYDDCPSDEEAEWLNDE